MTGFVLVEVVRRNADRGRWHLKVTRCSQWFSNSARAQRNDGEDCEATDCLLTSLPESNSSMESEKTGSPLEAHTQLLTIAPQSVRLDAIVRSRHRSQQQSLSSLKSGSSGE